MNLEEHMKAKSEEPRLCSWCAYSTGTDRPHQYICAYFRHLVTGQYQCSAYLREPGADDER